MIAIVGASGSLGSDVARRLIAAGQQVVAVTRTPAKVAHLERLGATVRVADLVDRESVAAAVRGASAVFATAHSLLGRGRYASANVDEAGHRTLIHAAKAERIEYFVYTSVIGADLDHPVAFWRRKAAIEQYLASSGLDYTVLRPAAYMETHAHELIGKAILNGGTAVILGRGEQPVNLVAARDVGAIAARCLTNRIARGATIEIGGPANPSRNEVAALYARLSGRPLKVRHVPLGALRVLSRVLGPLHPGVGEVMRMAVELESIDQAFDPTKMLEQFPMSLTTLETYVRERIDA